MNNPLAVVRCLVLDEGSLITHHRCHQLKPHSFPYFKPDAVVKVPKLNAATAVALTVTETHTLKSWKAISNQRDSQMGPPAQCHMVVLHDLQTHEVSCAHITHPTLLVLPCQATLGLVATKNMQCCHMEHGISHTHTKCYVFTRNIHG